MLLRSPPLQGTQGVPSALASFVSADALTYAVPSSAALVYVDDTAWDAPTIDALAGRLARLASGTIVIHNTATEAYALSRGFRHLASVEVGTSWDRAHQVHVHEVA